MPTALCVCATAYLFYQSALVATWTTGSSFLQRDCNITCAEVARVVLAHEPTLLQIIVLCVCERTWYVNVCTCLCACKNHRECKEIKN